MERIRDIAKKRIRKLIQLAEQHHAQNPERSKRYVELAKKVSKKYNQTIPKRYKKRICNNCGSFLVPGENMKVRITSKPKRTIVYTCLECGHKEKQKY